MKKTILIFISISIITLTAQADSFYKQIHALRMQQHIPNVARQHKVVKNRNSIKFFYANRAARNGNAKAQFDLAMMYASGRGVRKNERVAFHWFHKSARNNYAAAKHYMGLSFLQGRGVRKQLQLARYWFKLAKKQGYRASERYLNQLEKILYRENN